nr:glycosyltransferase [Kibdelosporangium sp. MJ126-NF4]CEL19965.1 glycosyltransferase [Kibdelosporangium sp. MJ126-NF4]CTQ97189.1 glycosyltransferase [Kibdelosporangium sp. MJ126-NF4]
MRTLLTCVPGKAHSTALVPLIEASLAEGHEVAVATAETFGRKAFDGLDVTLLPSGPDWDQAKPETMPDFHQPGPAQIKSFARVAGMGMIDDLGRHIAAFAPDVVVRDAMEFGGWVAAEKAGVPLASFSSAIGTPRPMLAALTGPEISALAEVHGLEPDPELRRMFSHTYIHRKPRSLDFVFGEPLAKDVRYRPAMFDVAEPQPPDLLAELSDGKPIVHLSLGTNFVSSPAGIAVNRAVIEALADTDVWLVVTIGSVPAEQYGEVADNVRLVPFIDHQAFIRHCAVFLNHGSFSAILVAIAAGVPMGFFPLAADQPVVSMHLSGLGLGASFANVTRGPYPTLDPAALDRAAVRERVLKLLNDETVKAAVTEVRDDYAKLPPITEVVQALGRLT